MGHAMHAPAPLLYESAPKHMPALAQMHLIDVYINVSRAIRNHIKRFALDGWSCNRVSKKRKKKELDRDIA